MRMPGHVTYMWVVVTAAVYATVIADHANGQWPQWGGPDRNFTVETSGLADSWPKDGPPKLWYRELGDGYSSIVVDEGTLYTMYRKKNTDPYEYVIALDAGTGRTLWEHKIRSPLPANVGEWTFGPNATALATGDRLYVNSVQAVLHCLNKSTGDVIWERDLGGKPSAPLPDGYGYSPSPMLYKNTVIVPADHDSVSTLAGRSGQSERQAGTQGSSPKHTLVAFDPISGDVVWSGGRFTMGHSSPIVITFRGEEQLVLFVKEGLMGFDPNNGNTLWHHPIAHNVTNDAIMTPLWDGTDLIFCTSHGTNSGGRVIQLVEEGDKTVPKELWFKRKAFFGNLAPVRVGDHLFGANGEIMTGVNVRTGKVGWRKREFAGAQCLWADGKLIILDLNGQLGLATATSDGLTVHSRCQLTERVSLTPVTLVGKTLYVRDRKHIMALDISAGASVMFV